jgi:hypothetical protein
MDLWELLVKPCMRANLKPFIKDGPIIAGADTIVATGEKWHLQLDLGSRYGELVEEKPEPSERAGIYNTLSNEEATLLHKILSSEEPRFRKEYVNRKEENAIFKTIYFGDSNTGIGMIVDCVEVDDPSGNTIIGYGHLKVTTDEEIKITARLNEQKEKLAKAEDYLELTNGIGVWAMKGHELTQAKTIEMGPAICLGASFMDTNHGIVSLAVIAAYYAAIGGYQSIKKIAFLSSQEADFQGRVNALEEKVNSVPPVRFLRDKVGFDKLQETYAN